MNCRRRKRAAPDDTALAVAPEEMALRPLSPGTTSAPFKHPKNERERCMDMLEPSELVVRIEGDVVVQPSNPQDYCWPLIAVHSRLNGCGGVLFANSSTKPTAVCYAGRGFQFGRFKVAGSPTEDIDSKTAIAVCVAAVGETIGSGRSKRQLPFWYLERGLIASLRRALKSQCERPVHLFESPNDMGMFALRPDVALGTAPALPPDCSLRPLRDEDAMRVNVESGPGPNEMERGGVGCWGIEVAGELTGWAVRGPDGAIGMLHVNRTWRQRRLATAIIHRICGELQAAGLPCFAYVRDDNLPSRKTFLRIGFERVADVKWCAVRAG
eukprot:CAMPEP_0117600838 /NCGR_PEP_ID=MMETSP0784-20121206/76708_1 /TAXON_ID=39447 /ORGANISM="" /LENGTH=325 /DNA_ID=CAMNT_0005403511 /DNA_START=87 /DNA_END=1064 /DNA_ORIENTATION=-